MSIDLLLVLLAACLIILAAGVGIIWFFAFDLLRPILGVHKVRGFKSFVTGYFLRLIRAFCCDFKLVLTGDIDKVKKTKDKKCILIGNHQTELDWLYIQYFYQEVGRQGNLSAVMKGSLGSIPVMGYAFRDMGMCLLDRNWEKDKKTFDTYLSNFVNAAIPVCTYICPEGTTLSESTYQRSQAYAKKTGRPVFEHVLLPRSTGLAYMVYYLNEQSKKTGEDYYVYDTTMQFNGYHGEICDDSYQRKQDIEFPTIVGTFWGRKPIVCHFHVKVYSIYDIIDKEDDLETVNQKVEKWLDQQWMEKEKQMTYYANNQCFDEEWSKNRKVVMFDRSRKLKDSFAWIILYIGAFILYYIFFFIIRFVYQKVIHFSI